MGTYTIEHDRDPKSRFGEWWNVCDGEGEVLARCYSREVADKLVAHDALVEACKTLVREWPIPPGHFLMQPGCDVREAYDAARAAIAKATT